jgi:hypothetical protein
LLLAFGIHYTAYSLAVGTVTADSWKDSHNQATRLVDRSNRLKGEDAQVRDEFKHTDEIGQHLVGNAGGRTRWMELLKAVNACLPVRKNLDDSNIADLVSRISHREELHVTNIDCQQIDDVSQWYSKVKEFEENVPAVGGTVSNQPVQPGSPEGPKGAGWIVSIGGYHYHNQQQHDPSFGPQQAQFVRNKLVNALRNGAVELPAGDSGKLESVTMQELGISHPVLVEVLCVPPRDVDVVIPGADTKVTDNAATPAAEPAAQFRPRLGGESGGFGGPGRMSETPVGAAASDATTITLRRYDFVVHFCWQPKSPAERQEAKKAAEIKRAAAEKANSAAPTKP